MGRLEGRYDNPPYTLNDLGLRRHDIGVGVRATGTRLWFTREAVAAGTFRDAETQVGTAVVAAARLRRFGAFTVEAAWANGLQISRWQERNEGNVQSSARAWGGGWITELTVTARARVSGRASVAVSYVDVGEGLFASHRAYTTKRRHIVAGVSYDR
jgi:hypothetical protein